MNPTIGGCGIRLEAKLEEDAARGTWDVLKQLEEDAAKGTLDILKQLEEDEAQSFS
jgi:hypothetical protein